MSAPTMPPWFQEATTALHLARCHRVDEARDTVDEMVRRHGVGVAAEAALSWMDTAIHHDPTDASAGLMFFDHANGKFATADDVPAEVAWVGHFLLARHRGDLPRQEQLVEQLGGQGPHGFRRHVMTALHVCAMNLNQCLGAP